MNRSVVLPRHQKAKEPVPQEPQKVTTARVSWEAFRTYSTSHLGSTDMHLTPTGVRPQKHLRLARVPVLQESIAHQRHDFSHKCGPGRVRATWASVREVRAISSPTRAGQPYSCGTRALAGGEKPTSPWQPQPFHIVMMQDAESISRVPS